MTGTGTGTGTNKLALTGTGTENRYQVPVPVPALKVPVDLNRQRHRHLRVPVPIRDLRCRFRPWDQTVFTKKIFIEIFELIIIFYTNIIFCEKCNVRKYSRGLRGTFVKNATLILLVSRGV